MFQLVLKHSSRMSVYTSSDLIDPIEQLDKVRRQLQILSFFNKMSGQPYIFSILYPKYYYELPFIYC